MLNVVAETQVRVKLEQLHRLDCSDRPLVILSGRDSQDLLQRISTNDMSRLRQDRPVQTVFTNEKGRIVDVVLVLQLEKERLLLIGQNDGVRLREWIEKFIIMEDTKSDLIRPAGHWLLWGTMMEELLRVQPKPDILLAVEEWPSGTVAHLISFDAKLSDSEFEHQMSFRDTADYFDAFRIDHAIPWFGNEISDDTNPLETGLTHLVSFTKGCYVGQEVIARLDTYKKVRRKLVRYALKERPSMVPMPVYHRKEEVGTITTISKNRQSSGLGFLRTMLDDSPELHFEEGGQLHSVSLDG